jgi:hypothetical protein
MMTVLYGTISYIITHAVLANSSIKIINSFKNYFWILLILDISIIYYIIQNEKLTLDNFTINQLKDTINEVISKKKSNVNNYETNDDTSNDVSNKSDLNYEAGVKNDIKYDNDIPSNNSLSKKENGVSETNNENINLINQQLNNLTAPINTLNKDDQKVNSINQSTNLNDLIKARELIDKENEKGNKANKLTDNLENQIKLEPINSNDEIKKSKNDNIIMNTDDIIKNPLSISKDIDNHSESGSDSGSELNFDLDDFESSL